MFELESQDGKFVITILGEDDDIPDCAEKLMLSSRDIDYMRGNNTTNKRASCTRSHTNGLKEYVVLIENAKKLSDEIDALEDKSLGSAMELLAKELKYDLFSHRFSVEQGLHRTAAGTRRGG